MSEAITKAAEMALEAMELHATTYPHMQKGYTVDAIEALRAALSQAGQGGQGEGESEYQRGYRHGYNQRHAEVLGALT